jgi:heme/copper-type cytochrome/quinol oxidase subunit 2
MVNLTLIAMVIMGILGIVLLFIVGYVDSAVNNADNIRICPIKKSTTDCIKGLLVISVLLVTIAAAYLFANTPQLGGCACPTATVAVVAYASLCLGLGIVMLVLSLVIRKNSNGCSAIREKLIPIYWLSSILMMAGIGYISLELYNKYKKKLG